MIIGVQPTQLEWHDVWIITWCAQVLVKWCRG